MPGRRPLADPSVRRVALVRLRVGLGDLLCSVPALRALRVARPDLEVTLVTWPEMAPVVDRMSAWVDELLPFPGTGGIPERPPRPEAWQPFLDAAAQRRLDLALQCYGDRPAANRVACELGARMVGGFAPTGWTVPEGQEDLHLRYPLHEHEVWRHLRLVERLGVPLPEDAGRMELPLRPEEDVVHGALLARHSLRPGRYAVLHPGASAATRRWPVDRFAAVGDVLRRRGLAVVLTGVPGEHDVTAAVRDAMAPDAPGSAPVVDLTGATDLGGLALLLRDCRVLVGNDTGSAHLAAAVGAPSVTVFQPGDPVRWAHPHPRHRAMLPRVACAPCPHLECPIDFRCSRATTPEMVLAQVDRAVAA